MANETPNRVHAGGTFVGTETVDPPFTARAINAKGVLAFARLDVGLYRLTFVRALAFHEGYAEAALPAGFAGIATAQIENDAAGALVVVQTLAGTRVDPPVLDVTVWAVTEGEGAGPDGPVIPVPPAAGGVADIYVDPTNGSDAASGTQASPLQTLARAYALIPSVLERGASVVIHMRADTYPAAVLEPRLAGAPIVHLADEAWDPGVFTVTNGPLVAGAGTTANVLDITGLGFGVDALRNQYVRFLDGAAVGQFRQVRDNTVTDGVPSIAFSPAPAPGDTFETFTAENVLLDIDALPGATSRRPWILGGGQTGLASPGADAAGTYGAPVMFFGVRITSSGGFRQAQIIGTDVSCFGVRLESVIPQIHDGTFRFGHDGEGSVGSLSTLGADAAILGAVLGAGPGIFLGFGGILGSYPLIDGTSRCFLIANSDANGTWEYGHVNIRGGSYQFNNALNGMNMSHGILDALPVGTTGPKPVVRQLGAGGAWGYLDQGRGLIRRLILESQAGVALRISNGSQVLAHQQLTGQSAAGLSVRCRYLSQLVLLNGAPAFGRAAGANDWTTGTTTTDKTFFAADGTTLFEAVSPFAGSFITRQG